MLFDNLNLGEGFKRYFEFVPAYDEEQRHSAYYIRHEVYCRELGFEPVRENEEETDEYDRHSFQCLMRTSSVPTELVGCTRLVKVAPEDPMQLLPFEKHCAATLDRSIIDPSAMPRDKIAEVSRLAVISKYRRRKGEAKQPAVMNNDDFGTSKQPRFPYIPVGLYLGTIAMAQRQGIEHIFTLTEPRLAEHFSRLGVNIRPIGGPIEHRGTRIPSMMNVADIVKGLRFFMKPIWRAIQDQIEQNTPHSQKH
jgi:N-acyl amino acid synthase of PEP-CTERM/exosortase system